MHWEGGSTQRECGVVHTASEWSGLNCMYVCPVCVQKLIRIARLSGYELRKDSLEKNIVLIQN